MFYTHNSAYLCIMCIFTSNKEKVISLYVCIVSVGVLKRKCHGIEIYFNVQNTTQ